MTNGKILHYVLTARDMCDILTYMNSNRSNNVTHFTKNFSSRQQ